MVSLTFLYYIYIYLFGVFMRFLILLHNKLLANMESESWFFIYFLIGPQSQSHSNIAIMGNDYEDNLSIKKIQYIKGGMNPNPDH